MKKTIILSALLVGIGVFMGVLLVSSLNTDVLSSLYADENTKIGAAAPPVQMDNAVKLINSAMSAASEAVLPTVVYINVEAELKSPQGMPSDEFHDFFKFFGVPEGEEPGGPQKSRGSGSGVIVSENGYIVTNNHVVENATEKGIKVQTMDKKEYIAKLVGRDPLTDLALIKIEATGLPVAFIGDIEKVKIGEMVLAVGNPMGLDHTVTSGIISAIGRGRLGGRGGGANIEHYIQTDAAINPGNSGGGLFDLNGALVGINTAIATQTGGFMGYGFAIPVDLMKAVVNDLIDDGKIDRGYIGVYIDKVDETMAKGLGLDRVKGVLVQDLVEGGASKSAGLEKGDVILEIDGKPVNSPGELQSRIVFYKANDKVNVKIWRDGKSLNKTVTLKPRDEDDVASTDSDNNKAEKAKPEDNQPVKFESLGFSVAPLDSKVKKEYGVNNGAIVSDVKRFSMASDRGLVKGAVITEVDRKSINSPGELKKLIDSKKDGDVIILNVKYPERSQIVALEVRKS
jgi:serine protease Do